MAQLSFYGHLRRHVDRWQIAVSCQSIAETVARALQSYSIIMLRGHDSFAIGQTLDEAFMWTSILEECCEIILKTKIMGEEFIEYRKMSEAYTQW